MEHVIFLPSNFQITKGSDGKARLHYKKWSTSPVWLPEDEGIILLKGLPRGKPKVCCSCMPIIADSLWYSKIQQALELAQNWRITDIPC